MRWFRFLLILFRLWLRVVHLLGREDLYSGGCLLGIRFRMCRFLGGRVRGRFGVIIGGIFISGRLRVFCGCCFWC